jgi:hypothetical protein
MSVEAYLELLDWTARQMRSDQPGSKPSEVAFVRKMIACPPRAREWLSAYPPIESFL